MDSRCRAEEANELLKNMDCKCSHGQLLYNVKCPGTIVYWFTNSYGTLIFRCNKCHRVAHSFSISKTGLELILKQLL